MKKLLSIVLSVLLILPILASFGVGVSAESDYEKLWAEKVAYEQEKGIIYTSGEYVVYICYGDDFGEGGDNYNEYGWAFLLYTEKGKELAYRASEIDEGWSIFPMYIGINLVCDELREMCISNNTPKELEERWFLKRSDYRYIVQSLGITSEELHEAYRKMREEPETARQTLSFLSDDEFEIYLKGLKRLTDPENFMIEAACMENDDQGEMLLAVPGNVYIKELGYSVSVQRIMSQTMNKESFLDYDLTTESFVRFMDDLQTLAAKGWWKIDADKYEFLIEEQARQLSAAETGDNAVTALWVVALALPALAVVTLKRKRKI